MPCGLMRLVCVFGPVGSYLLPISKPSHEIVLLEKWHFEVCKQHQVMREADTAIVAKQLCLMLRSLMSYVAPKTATAPPCAPQHRFGSRTA